MRERLARLMERYGGKCHWCGRQCRDDGNPNSRLAPSVDHLVRRADGGKSTPENTVLACRACNSERHSPGFIPGQRVQQPPFSAKPAAYWIYPLKDKTYWQELEQLLFPT